MRKALVLTIGTEITCGEIVNSNAAWVSERLEEHGLRVYSHVTVRDQADEIARALSWGEMGTNDLTIVTGGLGPTSDDITRAALAEFAKVPLEFDDAAWTFLGELHRTRGLELRDSHRHQCFFPLGSERLPNPVGSALGFAQTIRGSYYMTLPGPPRELEGMWRAEVEPRLAPRLPAQDRRWIRWTCLGRPESEIADLTEAVLAQARHVRSDIEVGYRAQVPYVKVKIYADPVSDAAVIEALTQALAPFTVALGQEDLAELLLQQWTQPELELVDRVTGTRLITRLLEAKAALARRGLHAPELRFASSGQSPSVGLLVDHEGEEFWTELRVPKLGVLVQERRTLPFKVNLFTERGQRSATEWILWQVHRALMEAR